jgi:hypothetical protein
MRHVAMLILGAFITGAVSWGQGPPRRVLIVRNDSEGPKIMAESCLFKILERHGFAAPEVLAAKLTEAEEKEYGEWKTQKQVFRSAAGRGPAHSAGPGLSEDAEEGRRSCLRPDARRGGTASRPAGTTRASRP